MSEKPPILQVEGVGKDFPAQAKALQSVSLRMDRGIFLGLVGPDGAGKTTLLRIITGLMKANTGSVRVLGLDPQVQGDAVRRILGYMPQKFGLYEDLSIIENLNLNADLRAINGEERRQSFQQLLEFTDLARFQTRRAGALSGGMKQKLGLACALLAKPKLLLLDEPSVGVDPISRRELWKMVEQLVDGGMGIIWSTAYLDEAEICQQVLLLNEGKALFQGEPAELSRRVSGRAFQLTGVKTARRKALTELLDHPAVSDGVIEGEKLRLVLREEAGPDQVRNALPEAASLAEVKPRFEDAFIDLLGGGPGRKSILAEKMTAKTIDPKGDPIIEARDLSKRYGDYFATRDVNFSIRPGEIFGLLGPNGAGKSTTFKMMCGLAKPTSGQALVRGSSLQSSGGRARQKIGYMAQKFSLYGNLSVRQNLDFFSGAYGLTGKRQRERVSLMIELFDLQRFLNASPDSLPLGFKQRLALACAVMHEPEILFLDEPTSGVDPVTRREFWTHIYGLTAKGVTVMVTTHFMDEAEYCDRIGLVYRGQLIALGEPEALKKSAATDHIPSPSMEDTFVELIRRETEKGEQAA